MPRSSQKRELLQCRDNNTHKSEARIREKVIDMNS